MEAMGYENIRLNIAGLRLCIEELEILEERNEHGQLRAKAVLSEGEKEQVLYDNSKSIEILYFDEKGDMSIFHGMIARLSIESEGNLDILSLEAKTYSTMLDQSLSNRSFQDIHITNRQMMEILLSEYENSQMIFSIPIEAVGKLFVSYQESTWELMKRFLSRYSENIYVDSTRAGFYIRVGVDDTKVSTWDMPYSIERDSFREKIIYTVESSEILPLGVKVELKGRSLYVARIRRSMRRSVLCNQYVLCSKDGLKSILYHNPNIAGVSISGTVLDISRDTVKARMETDAPSGNEKRIFFPYSSVASSPDGGGWYCMPNVGEDIRVFFPEADESKAYVISNQKGNSSPAANAPMSNPDIKDISTEDGKTVTFIENGILVSGSDGKGSLQLTNDGVASLSSDTKISLSAVNELLVYSDGDVSLSAGTGIHIRNTGGEVKIKKTDVVINASKIWNN